MHSQELSLVIDTGGLSQKVAISTTSAQSTALNVDYAIVTPDTVCFIRQGADPTALATGVDQILMANQSYRVNIKRGNKLAFKTATGSGYVYITPGA